MSHPNPHAYRVDDRAERGAGSGELELTWSQRNALSQELFALLREQNPLGHHCFCGSDADLIHAVTQARADAARQPRADAGARTATDTAVNAAARAGAGGEVVGQLAQGELAERVAHLARTAQSTATTSDAGVDAGRREQLARWHEDDRADTRRPAAHGGVDSDVDGDA